MVLAAGRSVAAVAWGSQLAGRLPPSTVTAGPRAMDCPASGLPVAARALVLGVKAGHWTSSGRGGSPILRPMARCSVVEQVGEVSSQWPPTSDHLVAERVVSGAG